jgi:glycosyltransferase involved in cell wall biosynthesis
MTADAVGGVWTYATALVRALSRQGHEICLVTTGPPPRPDQLAGLAHIDGLTVEVTGLALEWMDRDGADTAQARETLTRIESQFRPDIVHLNGFREATFGFSAPILTVAHSCVASWWQACRGGAADGSWHRYLEGVADGLNAADVWVAPTAAFRDWLAAFYQPRTDGRTIWNGCDLSPPPGPKRSYVLAAGRSWDEAKNLAALGAVAPALEWPICVAGATQAPGGENAITLDAVEHLGELPHHQLIQEMRQAAIFVSPALYEPFGLTALEAAACGCALVLSDIPSLRELWDGAAMFFNPRDARALTNALQTVAKYDRLRNGLQQAARRRAAHYALSATADSYRALYADMLRPPQRSAEARAPHALEVHA